MLEVHGHRGARGHFPENTITGFIEAVKMGVHWLEMDVVISKDGKVVVSHEPWMNPGICLMPDWSPVRIGKKFNLYKMNYDEIKKFDCGKKTNSSFPQQQAVYSCKPLLAEVINIVESFVQKNNFSPVKYSIELKSHKIWEGKFQPPVREFAAKVYEIIRDKKIIPRTMLQSFDRRILRNIHRIDKKIKTGFIFCNLYSVKTNLKKLGFMPYSFNPYYKIVSSQMIADVHHAGMKLFCWTVNDRKKMKKLMGMGVDGIVTDYPDILNKVLQAESAFST